MLSIIRCRDAIVSGRSKEIDEGVDNGKWYELKRKEVSGKTDRKGPTLPPITGWKKFPSRPIPENFNYGHIYHYLLESVKLPDGGNSSDVDNLGDMTAKPLRKGEQYVKSQSLSSILDNGTQDCYYVKANVDASMLNKVRHPVVTISGKSGAVLDAACDCPANSLGRCSHVGALLLTLNNYCKENGHDPISCTGKPCAWNKGKKREKNPQKISDASYPSYKQKASHVINFDPRPEIKRGTAHSGVNSFLTNLALNGNSSMWSTLLSYSYSDYEVDNSRKGLLRDQVMTVFDNLKLECNEHEYHFCYEVKKTQDQSVSEIWTSQRYFRVTASNAKAANALGASLISNSVCNDKLRNFIARNVWKLNSFCTTDMKYGIDNEAKARADYLTQKRTVIPEFKCIKTGFWVSKLWPELGCSPDGLVYDPSVPAGRSKFGLIEIKCLKMFKNISPMDLHTDLDSYVTKKQFNNSCVSFAPDGKTLLLKENHMYYYQIQFQLLVTGLTWCDFVLWSPKGVSVQRIERDQKLIDNLVTNTTCLWHRVICPEKFEMRVPRNLNPVVLY
ncbi:uncharacterized protein LOC123537474 isoform X2 [Mercenaria mercenaria]|uniref:uncharacterized protein LOC123537474 isoform X2 n=1 Tax=Mercenaria mercenaria TaxID=6596 RepID=UPI00234F4E9B|nr:uncharacterized protein LOC123537474 isoform X2 [Mercenaria mercenaria]